MPVLLNERLYKQKKAIRILTPLPPSGNVMTLCIRYCIYFLTISPSVRLPLHCSLLPCMHSIFILTLNAIPSLEIRYPPGCPLLFKPRSEDSSYDLDTALSLFSPLFLSKPVSLSPSFPFLHPSSSPPLLPHLSLALNQMEHIKSGTRGRQWLL